MQVIDGRPIEVEAAQDHLVVFVNGRKVMALPAGSVKDLAAGLSARKLGEHTVSAVDDGRPVTVEFRVGPQDPVTLKVGGRKVMQVDTPNADLLYAALNTIDSGESGPGEAYSAAPVAAPESTASPVKTSSGPPLPDDAGAGAPVGKAPSAPHSEQSSVSTERAPAPAPRVKLSDMLSLDQVAAEYSRKLRELADATFDPVVLGANDDERYSNAGEPWAAEAHADSVASVGGLNLSTLDDQKFALPEYRQVRSWSQLTDYEECGWCYKRKRIDKVEQLPAWWIVGGTAVHSAIEAFEIYANAAYGDYNQIYMDGSPPIEVPPAAFLAREFAKAFPEEIAKVEDESGIQKSEWRAAKKGQEDEAWWWSAGMNMLRSYAQDYASRTWTVEAMEYHVAGEIGGVNVQGYIDRLDDDHRGRWLTDMKSGQAPKDIGQLVTYVLLYKQESQTPHVAGARYHLTREGRFVEFRLDELEPYFDAMAYRYSQFDKAEYADLYLPRLSGYGHNCSFYYDMEIA